MIYGGLSGRLDQTTAVLSLLHKLRRKTVSKSSPSDTSTDGVKVAPASEPSHDRSTPGTVKLPTGEQLYISYTDDAAAETGRRKARGVGKRDIRVVNDDCIAWVLDSVSMAWAV